MSLIWRFTGFSLLLIVLAWAALGGGRFEWFVDLPSMAVVFGGTFFGLWTCFGPVKIVTAVMQSFAPSPNRQALEIRSDVAVMDRGYQLAWGLGIIGMFLGAVLMLQQMDDPSMIGPGMAVSFLSILYGAALAELGFGIFREGLQSQLIEADEKEDNDRRKTPRTMAGMGAAAAMFYIAITWTMLAALGEPRAEIWLP